MSQNSPLRIRKAAVLGAGVMGAQIAAHLANAGVPVVLFDLAAKDGDSNEIVRAAIEKLKKLEPPPLAARDRWACIDAANYDQNLAMLAECDLVIEAISERMDWKKALYEKVAPHVGRQAIFASNTSGLSINALGEACPPTLRPRFCGIHFFNPPRYMHLVELIARLTGFEGEIRWQSNKPDGQPRRQIDTRRAFERFGFQAQTSLEQGLRQTIDWYETSFKAKGA